VKIWLAIVLGSAASLAVLWLTSLPLGIPGEWTWERSAIEPDAFWNLIGGVVAAGLFIGFALQGRRRCESIEAKSKCGVELAAWLIGLVAISFAWLWIVQEMSPLSNRLGKSPFVLYYESSSGYFTRARYKQPSTMGLLTGYEDLMREGDVLHTGTHPPGLFLVFQGLIFVCRTSGSFSGMLDVTQPASFREACEEIARNSIRGKSPLPFLVIDHRVLWLATVVVMLSASLTVIPLFGLLCRHSSLADAWIFAALWPAIPAVAIFVPKSDAAFPLIGATLMWLWLTAWDRRSLILALLAGFVTWCGLMCSLAFLPIVLAAGIMTLGSAMIRLPLPIATNMATVSDGDQPPMIGVRRSLCIVAAGVGIAAPTYLIWSLAKLNMLNVWLLNYQNHAGFYGQYPRTYWKWLLINPLELSFAAGWPLTFLAILACANGVNFFLRRDASRLSPNAITSIGSIVFVWGMLWITGKNSGEAARLWILLLPWIIVLASISFESIEIETSKSETRWRPAFALLAIQFAVCLLTVARVSGFHLIAG
jgi:hypothetical protein